VFSIHRKAAPSGAASPRLNPLLSEAVFSIPVGITVTLVVASSLNPLLSEAVFSISVATFIASGTANSLNPLLSEAVFSMRWR